MVQFALNHMSVARVGYEALLDIAARTGCVGVEVRTDLTAPLFDGLPAGEAGGMARDAGLRLLAVAEVSRFDDWTPAREAEARALIEIAHQAGAESVALIPACGGTRVPEGGLDSAIRALAPMLADHGLIGLIEPLGFGVASLRCKSDALAAIDAAGAGEWFRVIHDTFHHYLAGEAAYFADRTGLVHISGVTDRGAVDTLTDAHRGLVDGGDRLGNVEQIVALTAAGYVGPFSVEAFAPETHALTNPVAALIETFEFIRSRATAEAA
ncbi:2-keto-myo-inositol isomerase [Jannaschia faecimaris]|uniref:2-keto-myo-inositol isomerase n=2 Tax=Jannaschia faecimaris TaxID=1244108 RepID=A0A1H3TFA3_9RHOB|nr:2-keto-myo-inositol isomerase [Jannaschia faecimaris]